MITLRDYQRDFIASTARGFVEFDRQLGVLPTGAGKTICFAAMAKRFLDKRGERTLILAHRDELVRQAADKLSMSTGLAAGVEKAEFRASLSDPVVVASVQTMRGKRLERWPTNHFGLVICDEAHHAVSPTWRSVLAHFDTRAKVLGVTATPNRTDKKSLGKYFENISYEIGLLDLIQRGYLSPIVIRTVPLQIDLNNVETVGGDYDAGGLADAIEPLLLAVIGEIKRCAGNRKMLVFLPLIKTSQLFVELCIQEGLTAVHVDGGDRSGLADFHEGRAQICSNAMLLTEGYDFPPIDCVLVLRPTKSASLYSQMVGRGTRIHPGKGNLLLLDFLWLHEKHDIMRPGNLIADDAEEAAAITSSSKDAELDIVILKETAAADREDALAKAVAAMARRKSRTISLEEMALSLRQPWLANYEPTMGWHSAPATQKQLEFLGRHKISASSIKGRGHATDLINRIFTRSKSGLASVNQVIWLRRLGYPDPERATASQAKAFLASKWGGKNKKPLS